MKRKLLLTMLVSLSLFSVLSACGRKGDPVLPKGQEDDYRRQYPNSTDPQTGVFN